jgi:uncharacterized RDD family membrane protein YckC
MACTNHPAVNEGIVRCVRCHKQFCADCVAILRGFPYCAGCKGEEVRDIQSGTAPGSLELASIWRRLGAVFIDNFITQFGVCLIAFPIALALGLLGGLAQTKSDMLGALIQLIALPFAIVIPLVYEGLMLKSRGQTLGKMAVGIKVVTPSGTDISPSQAWKRAGVKAAFSVCCALIDLLPALFAPEKTCLHDSIAETRVVKLLR